MTHKLDCRRDRALTASWGADMAPAQELMPVWRASVRMALVTAASLLAAGLIVTGLGACADMSGIAPTGSLRDAPPLGLTAAAGQTVLGTPVAADWWRDFGDETLNRLEAQALAGSPNLKLAQARLARAQAATDIAKAAFAASRRPGGSDAPALYRQQADTQAARVPLASQVARTYFQLVRLNERVDVARRTLALGHAVALIRALGGGDAPEPVAPMRNTTKLIAGNARVVSVNGIFDR